MIAEALHSASLSTNVRFCTDESVSVIGSTDGVVCSEKDDLFSTLASPYRTLYNPGQNTCFS